MSEPTTTMKDMLRELARTEREEKSKIQLTMSQKYNMLPIDDEEVYNLTVILEAQHWVASEIKYIQDRQDYLNLEEKGQRLSDKCFGFFAPSDGILIENIVYDFLQECSSAREKDYYIVQLASERCHSYTYSFQIYSFYERTDDAARIFNMAEAEEYSRDQMQFMAKYTKNPEYPKAIRYWAFSLSERVFFINKMVPIFKFRADGIFLNVAHANELILRDELNHAKMGSIMTKRYMKGIPHQIFYDMAREVLELECKHNKYLYPEPYRGVNADDLTTFTKCLVDSALISIGLDKLYDVENPFNFTKDMFLPEKGNFYEVGIGNYRTHKPVLAKDIEKTFRAKENVDYTKVNEVDI